MKFRRKAELIFWMVTLGALPAWANNPPQPDGLFSLILIFPVAIFGYRLAGVAYTERQRKWRVARGLALGLAVLVSAAGTGIAAIPLLLLLIYGCIRGVQIILRGQGPKRVAIGTVVCLWTLFAISDYMISLNIRSPVAGNESAAVSRLRSLAQAEETYTGNPALRKYATLERLHEATIPLSTFASSGGSDDYYPYLHGTVLSGYRFSLTVDPSGEKFLITAVPSNYAAEAAALRIPGASWIHVLRRHVEDNVGQRSFAVDESGTIRAADLGTTRAVTREEAEKWAPLQ
jgi:hypothetical protein